MMSEKGNSHEEMPLEQDTQMLLTLIEHLASEGQAIEIGNDGAGQNTSLDFTINLENLDLTALQNLVNSQQELPPEQLQMLLNLIHQLGSEGHDTEPQAELPLETPGEDQQIDLQNIDLNMLPNLAELGALSNLPNIGDLSSLADPNTLASLSNLIGLNTLSNSDLNTLTTPQDFETPLNIDLNALSNLTNLTALVNLCNGQIDLQDPNVLSNLTQILNLENLAPLLNAQDQDFLQNQPNSNNQVSNQYSGSQRYSYNSNPKRKNAFPKQSTQRWKESTLRDYPQDYENTINFDNNPFDQRSMYSNNSNNMRNGNMNNKKFNDNNNKFNKRKRPQNQNFSLGFETNSRQHSEAAEKMLEVPLNEIAYAPNSTSTNNVVTNFLERGDNPSSYEQKSQEEPEVYMPSYYSDKLGLAEQYLSDNETPITKTLKKFLITAEQRKDFIDTSIKTFQENLEKAKRRFFELQPNFDLDSLDMHIDELISLKNKKSTLKKSISKISPAKSKSKTKSKPKKLSEIKGKSSISSFDRVLNNLGELGSFSKSQKLFSNLITPELTSDLIKKTIKNKFNVNPEAEQVSCIQMILNRESCIYRYPSYCSKSITYESIALLSSGIGVYVHPSSSYLITQYENLSHSLSGGYLGSLISREKMNEHITLAKKGQLKILFTTPEKFIAEDLSQILDISFICLDEAQCVSELSSNSRINYHNLMKFIKKKMKFIPILAFVPPISQSTCNELTKIIHVSEENIFPSKYINPPETHYDISITRDEDKPKALLDLLKSPKYKNQGHSMILYADSRKIAEEITSLLTLNGYKVLTFYNARNDSQKFEIISHIRKNNEGIIVITSNAEIGIDKNLVDCVIHYAMPKSLEIYIQEISFLKEQAVCHLFLNDEDYFTARINFQSEIIEKDQLKTFIDKILEVSSRNRKARNANNKKKKDMNISFSDDFDDFGILMQEEKELNQMQDENDICSILVNELCQEVELKKETVIQVFEIFEELEDWLEFCGVAPTTCTVKILPGNAAFLVNKESLIKMMVENTEKESGLYTFAVPDMAVSLGCTTSDVIKTLKNLKNEGSISYEIIEEAFCYRSLFDPNPVKVNEKIAQICGDIQKRIIKNVQKLDLMYAAARLSSYQTIEHIYKQVSVKLISEVYYEKSKIESEKLLKNVSNALNQSKGLGNSSALGLVDKEGDSLEKKKGKINITDFFEKYLNCKEDTSKGYEQIWDGSVSIWDTVPLTKIRTQRDKSSIIADATPLLNEIYEEMNFSDDYIMEEERIWDENVLKARLARNVTKIMQGLQLFSSKRDWKSHKLWGKCYRYDYKELYNIIFETTCYFVTTKNFTRKK